METMVSNGLKKSRCIGRVAALAVAFLVAMPAPLVAQQGSPFDLPAPARTAPYKWLNQHREEIECTVTPWQRVDLGTIGGQRIYAGDHCSMPSPDPITGAYKKVFSNSCDLHDICYFAPGNSKRFCDDMLKWRMDRDCGRAYPDLLPRTQCQLAATSWRSGLETPISTQYWDASQAWGKRNCRVNPPATASALKWLAFKTGALPADTVYAAGTAAAVCQADYNAGVHPGRVVGDNCVIGYGGREYGIAGGRVLIAKPEKVRWAAAAPNTPIKGQAVVGGGEAGRPLVVCRARQDNVLYAGKMVDGRCNIGLGGRELTLQPFELLVSQ